MKRIFICILLATMVSTLQAQKLKANKKSVVESVENHEAELIALSDAIWAHAETAFNETESAKLLADYAEKNGFTVERGVADMPTALPADVLF